MEQRFSRASPELQNPFHFRLHGSTPVQKIRRLFATINQWFQRKYEKKIPLFVCADEMMFVIIADTPCAAAFGQVLPPPLNSRVASWVCSGKGSRRATKKTNALFIQFRKNGSMKVILFF